LSLGKHIKLSILTLNLKNNSITDIGLQSMVNTLSNLTNLVNVSLDLSYNSIAGSAEQLLRPLVNLTNLSVLYLNLENNRIGNDTGSSLVSFLSQSMNLSKVTLQLKENILRSTGANVLLTPFKNLFNLAALSIDLESNKIGDIRG